MNFVNLLFCCLVIGMLISLFAVLAAAVVEHLRLEQWQHG
jgi:hypothetical protein